MQNQENGSSGLSIFQILTIWTRFNIDCAESALGPEESSFSAFNTTELNWHRPSDPGFHGNFCCVVLILKFVRLCVLVNIINRQGGNNLGTNETRSSWLNCALRDDEGVYWVSIGHYEAVAVGNWWYWVRRGHLCLYILHKVAIWSGVTDAWLTHSLTDFER